MLEDFRRYIWAYDACDRDAPRSVWRHFVQIVIMVLKDLADGMITLRAMSLVYTTLLSIVPLLAVSIWVLQAFGVHDLLQPALEQMIAPLGDKSVEVSNRIVGFVDRMNFRVLGVLGLALLVYTVFSLVVKIESALNYSWRMRGRRSLLQRFSNYLSVILVGPVLVFSAVGITASFGNYHVVNWLNALPYMNDLLRFAGKLLPFMLVIIAFTFIYLLVPSSRVKFGSALYGAIIAGALWQSAGIAFTRFVSGTASYTVIYSGLAILMIFMIWLYISWVILLIGASIAYYHQHPEQLRWNLGKIHLSARIRDQLALQAMLDIGRAHDRPEREAPNLQQLAMRQRLPADVLHRLLDALETDGLLQRAPGRRAAYIPGAALEDIRLADILRSARHADDAGRSAELYCDWPVGVLLQQLERDRAEQLGGLTLADLIRQTEEETSDENSLVQRQ